MHRGRQEHPGSHPRSDNDTKGGFVSTVTIHGDQGHSPLLPYSLMDSSGVIYKIP